jgi:uncharacterized protein YcbK (DUF882 family)
MGDLSPHFSRIELECHHCGAMPWTHDTLLNLEGLRVAYGRPMKISSGYRCPDHPREAAKWSTSGAHTTTVPGEYAIDVVVSGRDAADLVRIAMAMLWPIDRGGIGIAQMGEVGRFIHIDNVAPLLPGRPRPWIWSY